MQKKKRRLLLGLCALLVIGVIGSSLAYWNQTAKIENPFDTPEFGTETIEEFVPGPDLPPGAEVNKDVYVKNTGTMDLIVRVRLDETWTRKGEDTPYKDSKAEGFSPYVVHQDDPEDGLTKLDGSVMEKVFSDSTKWIDGGDGWFYYAENLPPADAAHPGQEMTEKWLDAVVFPKDADIGVFTTDYWVSTTDSENSDDWVWFPYNFDDGLPQYILADGTPCSGTTEGAIPVLRNKADVHYLSEDLLGYAKSKYILTVTTQTVQPTQEAIDAVFGEGKPFKAPEGTNWKLIDYSNPSIASAGDAAGA